MGIFDFMHRSGASSREYTEADRPATRLELAKLVFKDHFFDLIPINTVLLVISLPALFWLVTGSRYILSAMGDDGTLADLISLSRTWVLVLFPCIAIGGPFLQGAYIMLRNLARDDFQHPKHVFTSALRSDWKQALLLSCISGAIPLFLWAGLMFYGPHLAAGRLLMAIPLLLSALLCLLWYMALPLLYTMLGSYRLPLAAQIKNAIALTLRHLPLTLGIELLAAVPLLLIPLTILAGGRALGWLLSLICAYYLLFGFAVARLLHAFLANYLCETYLNPHIQGAGVNIGMRKLE